MSLVQRLTVEAEELEQLEAVISIIMKWHSKAVGFRKHAVAGRPVLSIYWYVAPEHQISELIAPITSPHELALMIMSWLKTVEYGNEPDHDGSNSKGWRVTIDMPKGDTGDTVLYRTYEPYHMFSVTPAWIEYGK